MKCSVWHILLVVIRKIKSQVLLLSSDSEPGQRSFILKLRHLQLREILPEDAEQQAL